jgi:transposase
VQQSSEQASDGLEVVHPEAAVIDVGNSAHYVAVRPNRDQEPVRRSKRFTADLHRMADWLQSCGVKVASHAIDRRLLDSAL